MYKKFIPSLEGSTQQHYAINQTLARQLAQGEDVSYQLAQAIKRLARQGTDKGECDSELLIINALLAQQLIEKKLQSTALAKALRSVKKVKADLNDCSLYTKSLLDATQDPFATVGLDGIIINTNQAMLKVLGLGKRKIVGMRFCDCFIQFEKANNLIFLVQRDKKVTNYELQFKPLKGEARSYLINAILYTDETGKTIGVFTFAREFSKIDKTQK